MTGSGNRIEQEQRRTSSEGNEAPAQNPQPGALARYLSNENGPPRDQPSVRGASSESAATGAKGTALEPADQLLPLCWHTPTEEDVHAIRRAAGINDGEIPFGPQILSDGLRGLPEGERDDARMKFGPTGVQIGQCAAGANFALRNSCAIWLG
jgi:hypothetical protein